MRHKRKKQPVYSVKKSSRKVKKVGNGKEHFISVFPGGNQWESGYLKLALSVYLHM